MSRESELDKIIKDLIGILVTKGKWTVKQKIKYDGATRERSRLMYNGLLPKSMRDPVYARKLRGR